MRKLHRNNKVLVRRIRNLFDTALWIHNWGYVDILDSQVEVGDVRDYLDFYSWVTGAKYISPEQFSSPIYIRPLPVIRKPIALRDDNAELYYGVQIAEDFRVGVYIYKAGDTIYVHVDERRVALMVCAGCGRPIVGDMWVQTFDTGHIYCHECEDEYYFKCEECGEYFDEEYITASNDSSRHICNGCYENGADNWFFCDQCEEYCVGSSYLAYHDGDEVEVCEYCLDNYYHRCDDCDEYVHDDDGRYVDNWTWICDSCLDENWMMCCGCNEYYRADDMHVDEDGDAYCDNCWDNRYDDDSEDDEGIRGYHDGRGTGCWDSRVGDYGMEYLLVETRTDNPMLGVELEIDKGGFSHRNARAVRTEIGWDYVICSSDGSLDCGFELVSCPADLQSHMSKLDWQSGMDKAIELGYKSHDAGTCGLHTHIDREFFDGEDPNEVDAKFTVSFRNNLWWFKKFSRRDDRGGSWGYCRPNGEQYLNVEDKLDKDVVKNKAFVNTIKGRGGHGIALNFEHENTIEIRFYRGTLKYTSFMAALQCSDMWARLLKGITIEESVDITLADFIRVAQHRGYAQFLNYINERGITLDSEPKRKKVKFVVDDEYHYVDFNGSYM